ncbi:hypothetical protein FB451DRAFT_1178875 [Mycena latifolia]|nr:hypothetical protein FB451DRAFT_1178875 [Mycena latifolia]
MHYTHVGCRWKCPRWVFFDRTKAGFVPSLPRYPPLSHIYLPAGANIPDGELHLPIAHGAYKKNNPTVYDSGLSRTPATYDNKYTNTGTCCVCAQVAHAHRWEVEWIEQRTKSVLSPQLHQTPDPRPLRLRWVALQVVLACGAEGAKLLVFGCGERGGKAAAPVGEAERSRRTYGADNSEAGVPVSPRCPHAAPAWRPPSLLILMRGAAARECVGARLVRRAARAAHVSSDSVFVFPESARGTSPAASG